MCCTTCGLVQVDPQPSPDELLAYYRTAYREEHGQVALATEDGQVIPPEDPGYEAALDRMADFRAQVVRAYCALPDGSRVLEVGCGDGRLLAALEAHDIVADGVEPDDTVIDAARSRTQLGHVHHGTWETAKPNVKYDAIVGFHVLEHMHDPLAFLAWCRMQLAPGGRVFFEVPNTLRPSGPLERHHWQWVHLYDFTIHTLRALLHRAGFLSVSARAGANLQVWAVDLMAPARPYEPPQGAPSGQEVAQWLLDYESRFRRDEDLQALESEGGDEAAKRVLQRVQGDVRKLIEVNDGLVQLLYRIAAELETQSVDMIGSASADDWLDGYAVGRGDQMRKTAMVLRHIAAAAKRKSEASS